MRASTPRWRGAASTSICNLPSLPWIIWAIAAPSSGSPAISCGRPVRRGCGTVWLGGISLGGSFVLDYAATDAGPWDGLCLLAPYPGNRLLIREIVRTGRLAACQPPPLADSDEERRIWRFIQARGGARPPVYLGYGRDDRFAQGLDLMAQTLPPAAVQVIEGGHDWTTWSTLWERFLDLKWA